MRLLIALILLLGAPLRAADLVLRGATVYPAPEAAALRDAVIVIRNGIIAAIGPREEIAVAANADVVDCRGKFIVAGFWNCHVHLITPALLAARTAPAADLNRALDEMLNRWGFTHVFDLASSLDNTLALRVRIEAGELRGPQILTAGEPVWTEVPIYIRAFLAEHKMNMPTVKTADEAVAHVTRVAKRGAAGIKLFTGSVQGRGAVANIPLDIVRAATAEAHRRHLPVFSHAQNAAGLEVAIEGGVDVLAHVTPQSEPWTPELVARMRRAKLALIPTLTLFETEGRKEGFPPALLKQWLDTVSEQARAFSAAGGEVLFGTDVGYTEHFDTELEFTLLARAGLDFAKILAALTTAPAARFGGKEDRGQVVAGAPADLVVLDADPAMDVSALAKVRRTLRGGRTIYAAP